MYPASPALRQLFQLSPLLLLLGFAQHLLGQLTNYALSPATEYRVPEYYYQIMFGNQDLV